MSLNNPDSRRGLRSVVQAFVAVAVVALLYWLVGLLHTDNKALTSIARGALIILGMSELFYGAENVTRAVRFRAGIFEGGIGDDDDAGK